MSPTPEASSDEVQIISCSSKPPARKQQKKAAGKKARKSPVVIDLVSEDESPPRSKEHFLDIEIANLKRKLADLQKQNKDINQSLVEAKDVIAKMTKELESLCAMGQEEFRQKTSQIRQAIICGICLAIMWDPYNFVEWGHSFCKNCLRSTIEDGPHFDADKRKVLKRLTDVMRAIRLDDTIIINRDVIGLLHPSTYMESQYACPVCQAGIFFRPKKNYSLKAIIDIVADPGPHEPTGDDVEEDRHDEQNNVGSWVGFLQNPALDDVD